MDLKYVFWNEIVTEYTNSSGTYKNINYRNILSSNGHLSDTQEMGARFTWLIVPSFIFSENFIEFKKNISENLKFLDRLNTNQTKYSDFKNYRFGDTVDIQFSSEVDVDASENSRRPVPSSSDHNKDLLDPFLFC